jgi:tripartite-type tricarboxylate transporter receptor subunit TctC
MKPLSKALLSVAAIVGVAIFSPVVHAQNSNTKVMTMIVAFPPGGGSDVLGRMVAKGMQDIAGQRIVVENVVGVGGSMGVVRAANAAPDGQTILAGSPLELIYTPLGVAAAKNKPEDMRMAALIGHTQLAIAVRKDLPVNTLEEFVAYSKKADKPLTFGSTGIGSLYHLAAEKALQNAGAKGLHVPYNGLAPYLKDLIGGVIDFAVVPLVGPVLGSADASTIKLIALASSEPIARLPKLPPARLTKGFEDYLFSIWIGVQVTAKTPDAVVAALSKSVYASLALPEIRKVIESAGTVIADPLTLAQLDSFYKREAAIGAAIAKSINLQAQ